MGATVGLTGAGVGPGRVGAGVGPGASKGRHSVPAAEGSALQMGLSLEQPESGSSGSSACTSLTHLTHSSPNDAFSTGQMGAELEQPESIAGPSLLLMQTRHSWMGSSHSGHPSLHPVSIVTSNSSSFSQTGAQMPVRGLQATRGQRKRLEYEQSETKDGILPHVPVTHKFKWTPGVPNF